jgi:hypothetical protein
VNRALRFIPGLAMVAAATVLVTATAASAAVQTAPHHAAAAVQRADAAPAVVTPDGAPKGCPSGNFCSYNKTNGGNLCLSTPNSETEWGECTATVLSVFNNGVGNHAKYAKLFPLPDFIGAWYCLQPGHYLLDLTKNKFNEGGSGGIDYGIPMARNIDSSLASSSC